MKKTLILSTLLLSASLFAQTGSISGTITDMVTEQPIEGIKVILSDAYYEYPWDDSIPWDDTIPRDTIWNDTVPMPGTPTDPTEPLCWETLTGSDGSYKFDELPESFYSVYVDVFPEGYDPFDPDDSLDPRDSLIDTIPFKYYPAVYPELIELSDGEEASGIDLALIPWGSDTCSIAGKVTLVDYVEDSNKFWWGWVTVFSKNGQIIGGGFVDPLTWGGDSLDDSIPDGIPGYTYYFVNWLPPVQCYAVAEAWAYTCNFDSLNPGRDEPDYEYYYPQYYDHVYSVEEATLITPLNPILDGIDFDLEKEQGEQQLLAAASGSISGQILGGKGEIAYTTVYAKKDGKIITGKLNKDGTYTLNVGPGTYDVYASRPGYKTGKYAGKVTVADKPVTGINISMVYVAGINEPTPGNISPKLLIQANTVSRGAPSAISFSLPESGKVSVKIYDANGALVRTLEQRSDQAGVHSLNWDWRDASGSPLASGVYFCRVEQNGKCASKALVLIK